jgi:FAD/FMN-containing dehydrogenase
LSPASPTATRAGKTPAFLPLQLGAYLRKLTALMAEYGYRSPLYGHYGQGCVHLRINFDFRSVEGLRKFREFIDRAADLVLSFGGSLSGEHGDGQSRAALLPKMFGPELMQAFREFKALWDPDNRMNPGKLVRCGARLRPGGKSAPRPAAHLSGRLEASRFSFGQRGGK